MGRLADKLAKANDALAGLEIAVEHDVDKFVSRVQEVDKKREDAFLKKHTRLDQNVTDLAEFAQDLDDFSKNDRSGDGTNGNAYTGTSPPKI